MICFPNAKINLGLSILRKREDGYHDIETMMIPCGPADILEYRMARTDRLIMSGGMEEIPFDKNIVGKAVKQMRRYRDIPALEIRLHKLIPAGAGLGGGSSDAAFTIKMLNSDLGLGLSVTEMLTIASSLGSDCSFFIQNQISIASGRGEILKKTDLNLHGHYLVLLHPGIHISTAEAYSGVVPKEKTDSLARQIQKPVSEWKGAVINDFESNVFRKSPFLPRIKDQLYACGAVYASMSGSGSSIYGIFNRKPDLSPELAAMKIFSGEWNNASFLP